MGSTQQAPTIHVVDDDELFRTSISRRLRAHGFSVRNYASASAFLLAEIEAGPACILLDVRLPGPSGLDLQKTVAAWPDPPPIVFISGSSDVHISVQAMKAGAVDFLTKPVDRETLLTAVESALARGERDRIAREQVGKWRACYQTLTKREQEVFERVVAGKMNKQIASELGAAERTIKAHRAQVMKKMHAASVADLVHIATRTSTVPRPLSTLQL
jgi:FixJ family two-component response regulator